MKRHLLAYRCQSDPRFQCDPRRDRFQSFAPRFQSLPPSLPSYAGVGVSLILLRTRRQVKGIDLPCLRDCAPPHLQLLQQICRLPRGTQVQPNTLLSHSIRTPTAGRASAATKSRRNDYYEALLLSVLCVVGCCGAAEQFDTVPFIAKYSWPPKCPDSYIGIHSVPECLNPE